MKTERGSLTVELVLLAPVLMAMVLFGVHAGRLGEAKIQVQHAADQGARAGSQASESKMVESSRHASERDLRLSGVACIDVSIQVERVAAGSVDAVRVSISCRVRDDGTELLGLFPDVVHASSIEVIDRWRVR
ncbi:MAG: pilus assembly protein [Actinobacteria bacterium]|jgi:Flp pilus assembly protein TadG|nr:pilus assembly protein [Actinomycetota bacterium]